MGNKIFQVGRTNILRSRAFLFFPFFPSRRRFFNDTLIGFRFRGQEERGRRSNNDFRKKNSADNNFPKIEGSEGEKPFIRILSASICGRRMCGAGKRKEGANILNSHQVALTLFFLTSSYLSFFFPSPSVSQYPRGLF